MTNLFVCSYGSKLVSSVRMAATHFRTNLRVRHLWFVRHVFVRLATLLSHISKNFRVEGRTRERRTVHVFIHKYERNNCARLCFCLCVCGNGQMTRIEVKLEVRVKDTGAEKSHGSEVKISCKVVCN
jgi:hypothetical protein